MVRTVTEHNFTYQLSLMVGMGNIYSYHNAIHMYALTYNMYLFSGDIIDTQFLDPYIQGDCE